jgi:hypothetical protein
MQARFELYCNPGGKEHPRGKRGALRAGVLIPIILLLGACQKAQPRDDQSITNEVQASLYQNATLKKRDISIITHAGVVVLIGQVNSEDEKASAERCAAAVTGVKQVTNQLVVVGASPKPAPPVQSVPAPARSKEQGAGGVVT